MKIQRSFHHSPKHPVKRIVCALLTLTLFSAILWRQPDEAIAVGAEVAGIADVVGVTGIDRYVDASNVDAVDATVCTSTLVPCRTIQYAVAQSSAGDRIKVASGTYTSADAQVVYIPFALTLSGGWSADFVNQSGSTVIDAQQARRAIYVQPSSAVTLDHLTLRNGLSSGQGGGLYAGPNSPITLTQVVVENNVADNSGGGVYVEANINISASRVENNRSNSSVGGGLYGNAEVTLQNSNFISNSAAYGGGAYSHNAATLIGGRFERNAAAGGAGMLVSSTLSMQDSVFVGNLASGFGGGGIYVDGTAIITAAQFIENQSVGGAGGGLYARNVLTMTAGQFRGNQASFGGGAYTRVAAQLTGGSFVTNTSTAGGGLFMAQPAVINALSFLSNTSTAGGGGGVYAEQGGWVTQSDFQNNQSSASGGGVYAGRAISLSGTNFTTNQANLGGGLFVDEDVLLTQVSFVGNTSNGGAGLYSKGPFTATMVNFSNNSATGNGGAVYAANRANLHKSTMQGNQCSDADCLGGGIYLASGGDIAQTEFVANAAPKGGAIFLLNGDLAMENTLLARNYASTLSGSALHLNSPGSVLLVHNTIVSPTLAAGTAIYLSKGTLNISNTIIASQTLALHVTGGVAYEDGNLLYGNGSNSVGIVVPGAQTQIGHPAFVDPNADNYHLRASSLAINRGIATVLTVDADDEVRPQSDGPDIGMDESPYPTADDMALTHQVSPAVALPGQAVTYTLRFTNLSQIATNVVLTDLIPSEIQVTGISSLLPITAMPGNTYVWSLPNLSLNEGGLIQVRGTVNGSLTQAMTLTHAAQVGSARDNVPDNNNSTASLVVWMPVSGLSVNSGSAQVGSATQLSANVSGGSNVSYTWAFGDGSGATGPLTAHSYGSAGAYTVIVTASNGLSTLTQTVLLQVQDVPIAGLSLNSNISGTANTSTPVTFGSSVDAGTGVTYTWMVDGVVVGSGPTLSYTFPTEGVHTVTVTATNSVGSQTSSTQVVVIVDSRVLYLPAITR